MIAPPGVEHATTRSDAAFGGDVRTTNLDLLLATTIALGLPFATMWLYRVAGGATASLLLYYLVCCVLVARWRKGTLDYHWPRRWPWRLFGVSVLIPLAIAGTNWWSLPDTDAPLLGVALTLLIWSPLNAALEHLSWLYVLDAWRNRWAVGWLRWLGWTVGIVLLLVLVGAIHVLFWILFLPEGDPTPYSWLTIPLNFLLTASYVALYYRSRSMWPTFFVHLLADLQLVLIARYSILPYL